MYAYIPEIGCGFFEGVCPPSNATVNLRDSPLDSRIVQDRYHHTPHAKGGAERIRQRRT